MNATSRNGTFAAVDLGATSGRVVLGDLAPDRLETAEVHRFPNAPVRRPDGLRWDASTLRESVLTGIRHAAARSADLAGIGIDAWGVDYALLSDGGALLDEPFAYRDGRTDGVVAKVHAAVGEEELYSRTGLQFLPFNTIYQLAADRSGGRLEHAASLLLVPDLVGWWLTGLVAAETTNASTTGLLDAGTRGWATDLAERVGIRAKLLPPLVEPGAVQGPLRAEVLGGLAQPKLTTVGSHDTASAVAGVPGEGSDFAYISSGTWSLVGVELEKPIRTEESRRANFTNEAGVDGRIRYLRNVMGLWVLSESVRTWEEESGPIDLQALLVGAAGLPSGGPTVDVDDASLLPPGDMSARLGKLCQRADVPSPADPVGWVRLILDSLAAAYARTIADAARLSGRRIGVVHVVGGGARNDLLCRLTADACGLPVVAGPVEATAIGNLLVQARAHGVLSGDLETLRALVRRTQPLRTYRPGEAG